MATRTGTVKILDLGLSNAVGALVRFGSGTILGTADYMAPEQWRNPDMVDSRCDLYSLGCTLFFLLAGDAPFREQADGTLGDKRRAHSEEPFPSITKFRKDVPQEFEDIIFRLVEKDPRQRIPDGHSVAGALARYSGGADLRGLVGRACKEWEDPSTC
jgi:serine/threonine protein kinase